MTLASRVYLPSSKTSKLPVLQTGAGVIKRRNSAKFCSTGCLSLYRSHSKKEFSNTPPLPYTLFGTRSYTGNFASTSEIQSTVFRGTSFENRCLHLLEAHLGMVLRRVGGKEDGGVDLNGWWWLPHGAKDTDSTLQLASSNTNDDVQSSAYPFKRIRIIAQCKAEKKKIGPKYVRELEGVVWRYMALEKDHDSGNISKESTPVVAVFLSESPFTKSTILRAMSSQVPFLLVYVPPLADSTHKFEETDSSSASSPGSCIYNPALGASGGLFKGEMEIRWCWSLPTPTHLPSHSKPAIHRGSHGAPALFFRGKRLRGWVPPGVHERREEVGNSFHDP
ncbi:uncharacterized protein C8R40DRAFT_1091962 [Lentinula edodes]|uniref:uncharacterized protein n=1 Tax=Lentinula edodes TaxID=5353 RepID=UPI001BF347CE|nr:uncharacterized protein C8R40DRAFT_1091962 [Lentinula edodes]KAF8828138.1 hypothetical protein HHX47_DHR4001038 [Lentinula edodes]KAH7878255.1 hypothetical protein C8R40DRAFT_1091962 [Lentinula edodes]